MGRFAYISFKHVWKFSTDAVHIRLTKGPSLHIRLMKWGQILESLFPGQRGIADPKPT